MTQLGKGIYSVPQAARLVGVPAQRLRRWIVGSSQGESALPTAPTMVGGEPALEFVDLVSALFIRAFREHGVPLPLIRRVAVRLADELGNDRPFSLQRFKTDGRRIYEEETRRSLRDAETGQYVMSPVFKPLLRTIHYGATDAADRWYPLGVRQPVVVDPAVALGEPTIRGIPTRVLYGPVSAGESAAKVAWWYEVTRAEVLAACRFEEKMRAQKAA
jgi:uncharacterized protein (DUF433 family)